ncbi:hypothetical protein AB0I77_35170 [Streptomyces sp. NPDC050619]|uniref:hypothetical protein n=1 Tax=Streptomyces sp. NPDC050619 TaxID=3157214 RepID=UPI00342A9181
MQGHGYTQPVKQAPPTGVLVFLRVFFVVLSVLSFGLLTWTMLLRLAIVTRRTLDWTLFVAVLVAEILGLYLIGTESGEEIHTTGGWMGLTLLLGSLVGAISYYLAADIRHFHQLRFAAAYGPQQHPAPAPASAPAAYGYPQPQGQPRPQPHPHPSPQSPYSAATTVPQPPPPMPGNPVPPVPPVAHTPVPQPPPVPTSPPRRPAPARIDQVRAELDELSDYLRKHDGHHEGGR